MQLIDDASETPISVEQKLKDANKAVIGSVPLIEDAPNVMFSLPRGVYSNGKWETEVELRELTGSDEEALARFKESADFFNGVVVYGVARIGSIDLTELPFAERSSVLAGLLIGEREQLFLQIARITYGDEKELTHTCPSCQSEAVTTMLISEDIKAPEMEDPYTLTKTMKTVKGVEITYRLATGADQMTIVQNKGASLAEQNTLILAECITKVGGDPVVDPMSTARNLSMGDRQKLLQKLVEDQPSPDLNLPIPCIKCGFEMILPLSWGDIFRP